MAGSGTIALHNEHGDGVADAVAFVADAVGRLGLRLSWHDREDLEAQGLVIMLDLAAAYTPAHARKREGWCFGGYAGDMLPRRLLSAWHKQAGHRRTRKADGARGWDYGLVVSLDAARVSADWDESRVREWRAFERAA